MIKDRMMQLRHEMKKRELSIFMVPTADYHQSEYVGDYFKCRSFLSGFTGSAGTLVVTEKEAGLFTDGRYFIQAAKELENSDITLFRMGEENVPTIEEYIMQHMPFNGKLGFDGRVVDAKKGEDLSEKLKSKNATIYYKEDLVDYIWKSRPSISKEPAYLLDEKYTGSSMLEKIGKVRKEMQMLEADEFILTSLDDIAWLFNIRGNDVACNPVVLSYAAITPKEAILFLNEEILSEETRSQFVENNIIVKPYDEIYTYASEIPSTQKVLLDKNKTNFAIVSNIKAQVIDCANPTTQMKAIKNSIEIANTKKAHIRDGVAVTKFMYWLKNNIGKIQITEVSASDYLLECRKAQDGFIELSFETICAYQSNAAMMHYSANDESNAILKTEGLLLVDSGGQYYDGTTDITRTMALGPVPEEHKLHYTAVLRGMLNLSGANFLYGSKGVNLDILARGPVWELDIDYKCGTGHGVGHVLNVHEGPNNIRWKALKESDHAVLEEGMITTNEPGIYIEGSHGIRIENELVCKKSMKNEFGQFMHFETITFAPIDLDAVEPKYLSNSEKSKLNAYHKEVYEKISPYLEEKERDWLKKYTREI